MFTEAEKKIIASQLAEMSRGASESQIKEVGDLVFTASFLDAGRDTEYLLDAADPKNGRDELVQNAASICIGVLAGVIKEPSPDTREKTSTGSAEAESGFTPEGAIGKTEGLSYGTEANS